MKYFSANQSSVIHARAFDSRSHLRRLPSVCCALLVGSLVASCAGSAPEAKAPGSPASENIESPASGDTSSDSSADADLSDVPGAEAAQSPAPEAPKSGYSYEPLESSPAEERKRKARADDAKQKSEGKQYDVPTALADIDQYFAKLSAIVELSAPDCNRAETFRRAVCQLAERICVLEQDLPSTVERHCEDSRARCVAATSRYADTCAP